MGYKGKSLELAQLFRRKINSGEWKPGEKLNSIMQLSAEYKTAIATISKALEILENNGLIKRITGKGVFVNARKNMRIALVFDTLSEHGFSGHKSAFVQIFLAMCREKNVECSIFENVNNAADCTHVRKHLTQNSYDAVVISSGYFAINHEKILKNIPIFSFGLYPYKWLKCYHIFEDWMDRAVEYLLNLGCDKVAVISNTNMAINYHQELQDVVLWYKGYCKKDPKHFQKKLLKTMQISPRLGYEATCEIFKNIRKKDRLGIISSDSVLTGGVISAIFQHERKLWENVFLVSQANKGAFVSDFPVPLITYSADVHQECNRIFELTEEFITSGKAPEGCITSPVEFYSPVS